MTNKARALTRGALAVVFFLSVPIRAQDTGLDRLRSLTKGVPDLSVDRIELTTTPAMTFEGISAVSADKKGNLASLYLTATAMDV